MSATDNISDLVARIRERRRMGLRVTDADWEELLAKCDGQEKEIKRLRAEIERGK